MEKCAVVTGASKGIGLEIARKLSEEGYRVFGLSRTKGPLQEVTWISCDVTDSGSVSDGFAEVLQAAGRIDVLVANAGMGIELKPFGVQTCAIMLNDVRTEFTDNRVKTADGDDVYGGRIKASVSKMEKSERNGMTPRQVADVAWSLLQRKKMPSHKIVGISNEFLGLLYRLLPTDTMLWLLGKIYG